MKRQLLVILASVLVAQVAFAAGQSDKQRIKGKLQTTHDPGLMNSSIQWRSPVGEHGMARNPFFIQKTAEVPDPAGLAITGKEFRQYSKAKELTLAETTGVDGRPMKMVLQVAPKGQGAQVMFVVGEYKHGIRRKEADKSVATAVAVASFFLRSPEGQKEIEKMERDMKAEMESKLAGWRFYGRALSDSAAAGSPSKMLAEVNAWLETASQPRVSEESVRMHDGRVVQWNQHIQDFIDRAVQKLEKFRKRRLGANQDAQEYFELGQMRKQANKGK